MWKISLFSEELCSITIAMIIQTCDNWFHWHLPKVLGSLSQFSAIIWDSIVNFQNWLKFFLLIHLLEMLLLFQILTPPLFLLLFTDSKVLLPFAALDFAVMDDDGFPELDDNDTYSCRSVKFKFSFTGLFVLDASFSSSVAELTTFSSSVANASVATTEIPQFQHYIL